MSTWLEYNFENPELKSIAEKLEFDKPLHMTLVHFPRDTTERNIDLLGNYLIPRWVDFFPKRFWIYPQDSKLTQFDGGALVQEYIIPQRIYDQRRILTYDIYSHAIRYSNNYDWNPHVTVGQDVKGNIRGLYAMSRVLIIGVSLHHSFGEPFKWRLKV